MSRLSPAGGLDLDAIAKRQDAALQIATRLLEVAEGSYSGDATAAGFRIAAARGEVQRMETAVRDVGALLEEVRALRTALRQHGAHSATCDIMFLLTSDPPQRHPCSCGLAAALAGVAPERDMDETGGTPQL